MKKEEDNAIIKLLEEAVSVVKNNKKENAILWIKEQIRKLGFKEITELV